MMNNLMDTYKPDPLEGVDEYGDKWFIRFFETPGGNIAMTTSGEYAEGPAIMDASEATRLAQLLLRLAVEMED